MARIVRSSSVTGSSVIASLAILALVPVAFASSARRSARYAGTATDYMNNAPKWTPEGQGKVTFHASADGRTVRKFRGTYACYCSCGAGLYVDASSIRVSGNGSFAYRFSVAEKYGRDYVAISGQFLAGGSRAKVSYLVDFVGTGQHVAHPYSTGDSGALGCASWVRGTVSAL